MIRSNFKKFRILLFLLLSLGIVSCLKLEEIDFIDFRADYRVQNIVRVDEVVEFIPAVSTDQAVRFLWEFGDLNSGTSQDIRPSFEYDTIGVYTTQLTVEIQKSSGLLVDSAKRVVRVIPQLEPVSTDSTSIAPNSLVLGEANNDETGRAFSPLPNGGGYILLGKKNINSLLVSRLDINFEVVWEREFSNLSSGQVFGQDVVPTSDNGFLVVGFIQSRANENDAFILKLNADGVVEEGWPRTVNSIKNELYNSVAEIISGQDTNYVAVGTVVNSGRPTLLVDRYSIQGNLVDSKTFDTECQNCRANRAIVVRGNEPGGEASNTKIIIAGTDIDNPALFSLEFRESENTIDFESRSVIRNFQGQGLAVRLLSDGRFVLAGEILTGRADSTNAFVARFDVIRQGATPVWATQVVLYQESFSDIYEDPETNLVAIGTHFSPLSQQDVILSKFNSLSGALLDVRLLGNGQDNLGRRLFINENNQIFFIGSSETNPLVNFRDLDFISLPTNFLAR